MKKTIKLFNLSDLFIYQRLMKTVVLTGLALCLISCGDKVLETKQSVSGSNNEFTLTLTISDHYHFYDRECSIQRRYQKVIEETPSVAFGEELREKICATAVQIAKGINYIGAGTIEFILSPEKEFYFLEMNTRLQVEHPVTEMVTGFDLVELQIKAAAGEAFPFKQSDITQKGHSIECRIYAEDPDNEFLPTAGRIQRVQADSSVDYRLDCGYYDGNTISTSYDPMLAKVIVWEEDRFSAIEKMQMAMDDIVFGGAKTNRDYLKRILDHEDFETGDIHTHFIEQEAESLKVQTLTEDEVANFIAGASISETQPIRSVWDTKFTPLNKTIVIGDEKIEFLLIKLNRNEVRFEVKGHKYQFNTLIWQTNNVVLERDGLIVRVHSFNFDIRGKKQIFVNDKEAFVIVEPKVKGKSGGAELSEGSLQSPMPGKIFKLIMEEGSSVTKGDPVLIVEAMKMEHTIKATKDGVIKSIFFKEGDQVQGGVALCEIE